MTLKTRKPALRLKLKGSGEMGGNVSLVNGHIDEIADCRKCANRKECVSINSLGVKAYEYEILVYKYGCHSFKNRSEEE